MQEQEGSGILAAVPSGAGEEQLIGQGTVAAIEALRLRGKSRKAIARESDLDIKTVRKWSTRLYEPSSGVCERPLESTASSRVAQG